MSIPELHVPDSPAIRVDGGDVAVRADYSWRVYGVTRSSRQRKPRNFVCGASVFRLIPSYPAQAPAIGTAVYDEARRAYFRPAIASDLPDDPEWERPGYTRRDDVGVWWVEFDRSEWGSRVDSPEEITENRENARSIAAHKVESTFAMFGNTLFVRCGEPHYLLDDCGETIRVVVSTAVPANADPERYGVEEADRLRADVESLRAKGAQVDDNAVGSLELHDPSAPMLMPRYHELPQVPADMFGRPVDDWLALYGGFVKALARVPGAIVDRHGVRTVDRSCLSFAQVDDLETLHRMLRSGGVLLA